jgi:hypothetical protein
MSETLQILEKVNAFYTASFTQLITFTGALLALVGVLVPLLIALQQAKQAKRDQEQLSRVIDDRFAEAHKEFTEFLKRESSIIDERMRALVDATKGEISAELKQSENSAQGSIFHIQARQYIDQGYFGHAVSSACHAGKHYARAKAELNLTAVLKVMKSALRLANRVDMEVAENQEPGSYSNFCKAIQKLNESGRYTEELRLLQSMYDAAKAREPFVRKPEATDGAA